jgi:hypothetical protein
MREGPITRAQQQSWARDSAGVIVTVREQDTKELRTFHRPGLMADAITDACAQIDRLPGRWLISTISTPRTIAADLAVRNSSDQRAKPLRPERILLGQIGRLDLLEPYKTTVERGQMSNQRGRSKKAAA